MQSASHRLLGAYSRVSAGNDNSTSVVPYGYADYMNLVVRNGMTQGDHKSPNSFFFQKTRTYALQNTVTNQSTYDTGTRIAVATLVENYDAGAHIVDWSPDVLGALYFSRIPWASLADRTLQSVYDQMRSGKGNLVVDLAEASQTIKMIRNATSVRKIAKEFVRQTVVPRNMHGSRRLKYVSDKWLEYRYGWLPFVSSTYELLKTLSKKIDRATIVDLTARASYADDFRDDYSYQGTFAWRTRYRRVELSARHLLKVRMRARTTLELYDFTSLNPLGIAWELAPLSFVADWFTNVGDTLQLWEDHMYFANRFVSGFATDTIKEDILRYENEVYYRTAPITNSTPTGVKVSYRYFSQGRRLLREKNRFLLDALPRPGGLRVEVNLNAKRLLDAAALIRGAFGNPRLK